MIRKIVDQGEKGLLREAIDWLSHADDVVSPEYDKLVERWMAWQSLKKDF